MIPSFIAARNELGLRTAHKSLRNNKQSRTTEEVPELTVFGKIYSAIAACKFRKKNSPNLGEKIDECFCGQIVYKHIRTIPSKES